MAVHRPRIVRIATIAIAAVIACGGGSSHPTPDANTVDAFQSACGHPGDVGNELGIGAFCTSIADCATTPAAPLCSILGDPTTHFCTKTCVATGSAGQCGTATTCQCSTTNPTQCGCTPTVCL